MRCRLCTLHQYSSGQGLFVWHRAGSAALALFGILLRNGDGRGALFRTIGRIFGGFSDTAKAFLIIASALLLPLLAPSSPTLPATLRSHGPVLLLCRLHLECVEEPL